MLRIPMIIINFKTYENALGEKAVELAKVCEKVAKETNTEIAVAVSAPDIFRVSQAVEIPVLAQHIDPIKFGSNTGKVIAENVKENGAIGTLINHSERRIRLDHAETIIDKCKNLGLMTIACANDPKQCEAISLLEPDAIAYEPPELIGGDVSVSTANPEDIIKTVEKVNHLGKCGIILVGAGVKNKEDVKKSQELGAKGILLASGITKVDNPEEVLRDLVSGFKFDQ